MPWPGTLLNASAEATQGAHGVRAQRTEQSYFFSLTKRWFTAATRKATQRRGWLSVTHTPPGSKRASCTCYVRADAKYMEVRIACRGGRTKTRLDMPCVALPSCAISEWDTVQAICVHATSPSVLNKFQSLTHRACTVANASMFVKQRLQNPGIEPW
jgi:hypothetical protein